MPSWNPADEEPIAIDNVDVVRATSRALSCAIGQPDELGERFKFWVPLKQITPGSRLKKAGDKGTLSIPRWLWNRIRSEEVHKKPPPDEYRTDEIYKQFLRTIRHGEPVPAPVVERTVAELYLACRDELQEMNDALIAALAKRSICESCIAAQIASVNANDGSTHTDP